MLKMTLEVVGENEQRKAEFSNRALSDSTALDQTQPAQCSAHELVSSLTQKRGDPGLVEPLPSNAQAPGSTPALPKGRMERPDLDSHPFPPPALMSQRTETGPQVIRF